MEVICWIMECLSINSITSTDFYSNLQDLQFFVFHLKGLLESVLTQLGLDSFDPSLLFSHWKIKDLKSDSSIFFFFFVKLERLHIKNVTVF